QKKQTRRAARKGRRARRLGAREGTRSAASGRKAARPPGARFRTAAHGRPPPAALRALPPAARPAGRLAERTAHAGPPASRYQRRRAARGGAGGEAAGEPIAEGRPRPAGASRRSESGASPLRVAVPAARRALRPRPEAAA
ncbi:uncharacterized protein LOC110390258, partial [Numida meleagris]|uniref:uncharacterized protein LOC110390258 n=1 Tax=Numida meleagris TaxID=8996 RepID=UPI000B3DA0C1